MGCTSARRSRKPPATSFLQRPRTSPSDFKELVGLRTLRSARGGAEFVEGPGQATAVARRVAFWDRSGGDAVGACHRCSRRGGAVERLQARIRYRGVEFGQHSGWTVPVALRQPGARCGGPRYPSSRHPLPDLRPHRRLPARQPQRGPDRALPPEDTSGDGAWPINGQGPRVYPPLSQARSAVLLAEMNADLGCVCLRSWLQRTGRRPSGAPIRLDLAPARVQVMNAVIRIETNSPGSSTPSLAT